jgi:hypothetical protein
VTHHNRQSHEELTASAYARLAREVFGGYLESNEVRGPWLELHSATNVLRGAALMTAEGFLLGHEIAHLIAGTRHGAVGADSATPTAEAMADQVGARLSATFVRQHVPESLFRAAAPLGLLRLFELVALTQSTASRYMHPGERAYLALSNCLGEDNAKLALGAEYSEKAWFLR